MELSTGRIQSFDVVNVAMHVQKRQVESAGNWIDDLRPYIADKSIT